MVSAPHQFVTVDMRELKAALLARARTERSSVSSLVRRYVAAALDAEAPAVGLEPSEDDQGSYIRVSIQMTASEVRRFFEGAKESGLSRSAYLAELIGGGPLAIDGATRRDQVALLVTTNSELSTLSRNLRHLAILLSQGSVEAAQQYRGMLQTLEDDVQRHLKASAGLLAEVRQRRRGSASHRPVRQRKRPSHA